MGTRARPARLSVADRARGTRTRRDAEDREPAAVGTRGAPPRGRTSPRQEPPLPDRGRRPRAARAPHDAQDGCASSPRARRGRRRRMFRLRFSRTATSSCSPKPARRSAPASGSTTPAQVGRGPLPPRPGRARSRCDRASARSSAASAGSSIRSCATNVRSPASGEPTRTRSSTGHGSRRSRRRPSSPTRRSPAWRAAMHDDLERALELRERRQGRPRRVPGAQPPRRAVPGLCDADCAGGLRRAHGLLLPCLPDGREAPQGQTSLAAPALRSARTTAVNRCPCDARILSTMSKLPNLVEDLQASAPEIGLALSHAGVRGVQKAVRIRRGDAETVMAAVIDCTVDLAADQKGVHMSRFPELFEEAIDVVVGREALLVETLAEHIASRVVERQGALQAEVWIRAQWPIRRLTPVTGIATQEMVTLCGIAAASEARDPACRRCRGDRHQRVPVCAGSRSQSRERAASRGRVRLERHREDPRARPDCDPQPAWPADALRRNRGRPRRRVARRESPSDR